MNEELLFTSASLLDLLTQIEELQDKDISISEGDSGLVLSIGGSTYNIQPDKSTQTDVVTDEESLESIDDACAELYADLESSRGVELSDEVIESGVIKEVLKTLLIGGMVRLGKKLLK